MSNYSVYRKYVQFHEVWGSNAQNVITFESFALKGPCVSYHVLLSFFMFILDKIDMGGPKIVYKYILVGKFCAKVPEDQPRVIYEGTFILGQRLSRPAPID